MVKTVDTAVTRGQRREAPELVVTLDGKPGSGKSLLQKVLLALVPLLGFGEVVIVSREPEEQ